MACGQEKGFEVIKLLLDSGADVNSLHLTLPISNEFYQQHPNTTRKIRGFPKCTLINLAHW